MERFLPANTILIRLFVNFTRFLKWNKVAHFFFAGFSRFKSGPLFVKWDVFWSLDQNSFFFETCYFTNETKWPILFLRRFHPVESVPLFVRCWDIGKESGPLILTWFYRFKSGQLLGSIVFFKKYTFSQFTSKKVSHFGVPLKNIGYLRSLKVFHFISQIDGIGGPLDFLKKKQHIYI